MVSRGATENGKGGFPIDRVSTPTYEHQSQMCNIRTPFTDISATTTFTYRDSFLTTTIHMSNQINFDLCNFYSPKRQLIADLTKSLIPSPSTILMGDLNIHHPWWSNNSEARPELNLPASLTTVEWLETYNFRLHNCPGRPTYYPRMANSRPSVLDICPSTGPATEYIEAWSIDDESGSDHSIVGLLLSFKEYDNNSPKSSPTLQKRRNWSKADWSKFQRILNEGNPEYQVAYLQTESQILDAFKSISALINHALDESVPVITHSPKRIPWWNSNLNWIRTRLNRAERRWHTNHENKDRLIALQIRATWNRAVHRARFTYWQNKLEATDQSTISKTIRKHNTHTRSLSMAKWTSNKNAMSFVIAFFHHDQNRY
jgi:hypothetical protein